MAKSTKTRRSKVKPDADTCRHITSLIADYLGGELDPQTTSAFEAHVRDCRTVSYRTESVEATRRLRYDTLPPKLQDRALKVIQRKIVRRPRRRA
jgi:anti-sigma factor RsiW